jgi:hypothetical protein
MSESRSRDRGVTHTLKMVWERLLDRARILVRNGGKPMEWECFEDTKNRGDWRVEAIDFENEGAVYVTIFSGPESQERAREYAAMKSAQEARPLRVAS